MILIRLYPFIYCDFEKNIFFFYHIQTKQYLAFEFEGKVNFINKLTITVENTIRNDKKASRLQMKKYGIVDKINLQNGDFISNYSSELENYYMRIFSNKIDSRFINILVTSFVISFNSDFDLFSGDYHISKYRKNINVKTLKMIEEYIYSFKKIYSVHIYTDTYTIESNKEIISSMIGYCQTEVYIPIEDYVENRIKIIKLLNNNINVLLKSSFIKENKDVVSSILKDNNISKIVCIICNSIDEIIIKQSEIRNSNKVEFRISYNNLNESFYYSEYDILTNQNTMYDMIRNEWYNALYWGNLYIDVKGRVYCGPNEIIGTLDNLKSITYDKIFNSDSFWRKNRKNFAPCCNCGYRNICQPLSLIEIIRKKRFCLLKNNNPILHIFNK